MQLSVVHLQLTSMSTRNSSNFCHGTLAFSYLQLLILLWYILLFRRTFDVDRSAVCFGSRFGSGTSDCCTAVAGAAAASVGTVAHLYNYGCDLDWGCWLFDTESSVDFVAVPEVLVRANLFDEPRTDAAVGADDVAVIAARAESSDDNSERFVSLSMLNESSSSRSRSSTRFLHSFRYDLRNVERKEVFLIYFVSLGKDFWRICHENIFVNLTFLASLKHIFGRFVRRDKAIKDK